MKAIYTPIVLGLACLSVPAVAQDASGEETVEDKPQVRVIERDEKGKATRVSVNGREYALCSKSVQDSCISPRSAGFDWGNQPLDHWPGQTSTSLKQEREKAAEPTPVEAAPNAT